MIVFQNAGLIDIAAITTMGVSVKDVGSIGYFGTGLKFAIATILRNDGSVKIYRGNEELSFDRETIDVRGESFDRVTMNGENLGFTTRLGRDWEPWMAFREIACNAIDEGGHYWKFAEDGQANSSGIPLPCHTTIMVDCSEFERAFHDRKDIILEGSPIAKNEFIEIYDRPSHYFYYRGVRIGPSQHHCNFTYNILTEIDLSEDRQYKYWFQPMERIKDGVEQLQSENLIARILTSELNTIENKLSFSSGSASSEAFSNVCARLAQGSKDANPTAMKISRELSISRMAPTDGGDLEPLLKFQFDRAIKMLEAAGFEITKYPIIVADSLGGPVHGMAKDGKIFLSKMAFHKGTRELAATIFEEFAHLESSEADCTRGFQNWFIDRILMQIEKAAGKPF